MLEFDASIRGGKTPVDACGRHVTRMLPGRGGAGEFCLAFHAFIQALAGKHREFDLGQVQPTAMLGRAVGSPAARPSGAPRRAQTLRRAKTWRRPAKGSQTMHRAAVPPRVYSLSTRSGQPGRIGKGARTSASNCLAAPGQGSPPHRRVVETLKWKRFVSSRPARSGSRAGMDVTRLPAKVEEMAWAGQCTSFCGARM